MSLGAMIELVFAGTLVAAGAVSMVATIVEFI